MNIGQDLQDSHDDRSAAMSDQRNQRIVSWDAHFALTKSRQNNDC